MFWDTLERVNRLRQKAMSDPEFIESAKEHEQTLKQVEQEFEPQRRRKHVSSSSKTFADIYQQVEFGNHSNDVQH
ncbi:hypothetical protein ABDK09_15055 [Vibrio sp. CDRSL-10 TSBA]